MKRSPTARHFGRLPLASIFVAIAACGLVYNQAEAQVSADIFAVRTWMPPPPLMPIAEIKPAPPPPPQAPPLPFRFLGKIAEPGKKLAFLLALGNRVVSVGVGEVLDGIYLVEKQQGDQLYFIYQPMKIRQSMSVGRVS